MDRRPGKGNKTNRLYNYLFKKYVIKKEIVELRFYACLYIYIIGKDL